MKPIRLVQWGSSIALLVTITWILILATFIAFGLIKGITISELAQIAGVLIIFILPEKGSAFFGPVLKRNQTIRKKDNE